MVHDKWGKGLMTKGEYLINIYFFRMQYMIYVLVWKNALMRNVLVEGGIYEKVRLISLRDILNYSIGGKIYEKIRLISFRDILNFFVILIFLILYLREWG